MKAENRPAAEPLRRNTMKEKITEDLFIASQKLPRGMKYRFSKLIFKPVLEKEVRN